MRHNNCRCMLRQRGDNKRSAMDVSHFGGCTGGRFLLKSLHSMVNVNIDKTKRLREQEE